MTNLEPIIHINKSGNVKITDCVIIAAKFRLVMYQESSGYKHQFENIYFLTKPKWWDVIEWIRLVKTIYKAL